MPQVGRLLAVKKELSMSKKILSFCFILSFLCLSLPGEEERLLILVSNDDGINSPGIKALAEEMAKLGQVLVVAPRDNMSGSSHSQNSGTAIFYGKSDIIPGIEAYWVDNTPVMCIRWAIHYLLEGRIPDLVVSGINDGPNPGLTIIYSGTVGAAREGALFGAVGIAASQIKFGDKTDYRGAARIIRSLAEKALRAGKKPILWNVNFPIGEIDESREIRVAKLSRMRWKTSYIDRKNPSGKTYFWFKPMFNFLGGEPDSDLAALMKGEITVTPLRIYPTDFDALDGLQKLISFTEEKEPIR